MGIPPSKTIRIDEMMSFSISCMYYLVSVLPNHLHTHVSHPSCLPSCCNFSLYPFFPLFVPHGYPCDVVNDPITLPSRHPLPYCLRPVTLGAAQYPAILSYGQFPHPTVVIPCIARLLFSTNRRRIKCALLLAPSPCVFGFYFGA